MISNELIVQWEAAEKAAFSGWDFSYLDGRWVEPSPPWDYLTLARELIPASKALLDIATGGGEVLGSLEPFTGTVTAVEGYEPNFRLASERLQKFGAKVIHCDTSHELPLENGSMDLILNRHGGYKPSEVARILGKGGQYLTQQVCSPNLDDLQAVFGAVPKWPENNLGTRQAQLEALGLKTVRAEIYEGRTRVTDVAAVVYMLKNIPWLVDDFSVRTHLEGLATLQQKLEREGVLYFGFARFLLHVQK